MKEEKDEVYINKTVAIGTLALGIVGLGLGFIIGKSYADEKNELAWMHMFYEAIDKQSPTMTWTSKSDPKMAIDFMVKVVNVSE